jgi:SAM-dependent methyltransferase
MIAALPAFDAAYWQGRYEAARTAWDTGAITPPLQAYFDQLTVSRQARILIPGAGRAYEAEYLHRAGFERVFAADVASAALAAVAERMPGFPPEHLLLQDFFTLEPIPEPFDLLVEQTFFCALDPGLRPAYARQCARLLRPGGTLMGLLFEADFGPATEPPFGGSRAEYRDYFSPYFEFRHFETATNSIAPRAGRELFICLKRK